MSNARLAATIPPGNTIDATVTAMNAIQAVYPQPLSVTRDPATGGLLIVVPDPDSVADRDDTTVVAKAAKKAAKKAAARAATDQQVTIEMGTGEPGSEAALAVAFASDSTGVPIIAEWAATILNEQDAANYLTFTFRDEDRERYAFTIQRCAGPSPQERIAALEAELAALRA
jgi:hypothetical protein